MHLFYEMERAAAIAELIPKGGAAPAHAASADRRVSELEAKLAERDAALAKEKAEKDTALAALAEKEAALAEKEAELEAMRRGGVGASQGAAAHRPPYAALMRFGLPTARPRGKEAAREQAAIQRELTEISALALREQDRELAPVRVPRHDALHREQRGGARAAQEHTTNGRRR